MKDVKVLYEGIPILYMMVAEEQNNLVNAGYLDAQF